MTPPVVTVSTALSPSAMVAAAGSTVRRNAVRSLAEMVTAAAAAIAAPSCVAVIVIVSRSSTSLSSTALMVALPAVAPARSVMRTA